MLVVRDDEMIIYVSLRRTRVKIKTALLVPTYGHGETNRRDGSRTPHSQHNQDDAIQ